jgi:hypothetical protein
LKKTAADINLIMLGNDSNILSDMIFPDKPYCFFKDLCGEYPTAAGFALYLAFCILTMQTVPEGVVCHGNIPMEIKNILIYNHFQNINHSLIFVTRK